MHGRQQERESLCKERFMRLNDERTEGQREGGGGPQSRKETGTIGASVPMGIRAAPPG